MCGQMNGQVDDHFTSKQHVLCIREKKDIGFTMTCRGRKELRGSDSEINKGQMAFFFVRRQTVKSLPCALMDETQKRHLSFPRETNLSLLFGPDS